MEWNRLPGIVEDDRHGRVIGINKDTAGFGTRATRIERALDFARDFLPRRCRQ